MEGTPPLPPTARAMDWEGEMPCPERPEPGRDIRLPGFVLSSASKWGKSLHLRLPSLLSEPRRNRAIATLTAVTLKKSACLAARGRCQIGRGELSEGCQPPLIIPIGPCEHRSRG